MYLVKRVLLLYQIVTKTNFAYKSYKNFLLKFMHTSKFPIVKNVWYHAATSKFRLFWRYDISVITKDNLLKFSVKIANTQKFSNLI